MSHEKIRQQQDAPEILKPGQAITPDVDIFVNDREILLIADLPGVKKEDLAINVENNTLTLEGSFVHDFAGTAQRKEFESMNYRRVFTLPQGLDAEKTTAELKLGVLFLHLPKSAASQPRQIKVHGE